MTLDQTVPAAAPERRGPRTMPPDLSITLPPGAGRDLARTERSRGARRQPMRGFEDTYVDIVDYIVRITHRIWEDQDVGYIYDTYAAGAVVHDDHGTTWGAEPVVEGTLQAIHAFPDTRSLAEDVIWAGDEDEGFVTSHRYVNRGHHLGPWRWGPASGRPIRLWGIANCLVRENEIVEEWVLHNTCSRLAQAGVDVRDAARRYGDELLVTRADVHRSEVDRLLRGRHPEPYPGRSDLPAVEHLLRGLFHDVFNRRDLSAVDRAYAPAARWHGTTDREASGRSEIKGQARALLATFPDLGLRVEEVYWMGSTTDGRASVRWTAAGTHRGWGLYGAPTGRLVHLWGISQLTLRDGLVEEEWSMFNEFDVLAQLVATEPRALLGGDPLDA